MAYDTITSVTNDVTDVLASHQNEKKTAIDKLMSSVAYANYGTAVATSGTVTLTDASLPIQAITPGTASVTVYLPTAGTTNHPFFVINAGTAAYTVTVKNAGSVTIGSAISTITYIPFVSDATAWYAVAGGGAGGGAVVATGAELDTGTDNAKFASALAIKNAKNVPSVVPSTSGNVLTSNGTDWTSAAAAITAREAYIYIREEQAANTAGGGFTSGAWRTRVLNTEVNDAGGHASVASNQVTLAAGTYRFKVSAPAMNCGTHKVKLINTTDTIEYVGSSEFTATSGGATSRSVVSGRFTIAGSKVFEVQHRCGTTKATDGLGVANNFAVVEVYAEVEFWKE